MLERNNQRLLSRSTLLALCYISFMMPMTAQAASFVVEDGEVVGAQTLSGLSDKGLVKEGGTISTTGNGLPGIGVLMTNGLQELKNDGTIFTTGILANAVYSGGPSSLITNNGLIRTIGDGTSGIVILSTGTGSQVVNNGLISIEGNFNGATPVGIVAGAAGTTVINTGQIRTVGTQGEGILVSGASTKVRNTGLIQSTGTGSFGIRVTGANASITNNGTIIANTGSTSFAISLEGLNSTLNLQRESNIQGAVQLTQASTLNVQKGLNLALTTTGLPFSTITTEGSPFATSGNLVAVVDRTGFALEVDILDDLTAGIMNNLGNQYCLDCCNDDCCEYDLQNNWSAWIRGFGSYRERRLQHRTVKYDNGLEGGLAGLETVIFCDWKLGLFGGGTYGTSHVKHHSHVFKNTSGFGGLYLDGNITDYFVRFAITGGSLNQHSRRKVMNNLAQDGYQFARAKFHGGFVAPELRFGRSFCIGGLEPIVSADIRYSGLFLNHYNEKGSATNFRVKSHNIQLLTTATELAVPITFNLCNSCMTVTPYAGLEGRYRLGNKKLHGELLDQSVTFFDGSWNQIGIAFIGVRSCRKMDCGLTLMLDLEGDFDSKKSALIRGGLKAEMDF